MNLHHVGPEPTQDGDQARQDGHREADLRPPGPRRRAAQDLYIVPRGLEPGGELQDLLADA